MISIPSPASPANAPESRLPGWFRKAAVALLGLPPTHRSDENIILEIQCRFPGWLTDRYGKSVFCSRPSFVTEVSDLQHYGFESLQRFTHLIGAAVVIWPVDGRIRIELVESPEGAE